MTRSALVRWLVAAGSVAAMIAAGTWSSGLRASTAPVSVGALQATGGIGAFNDPPEAVFIIHPSEGRDGRVYGPTPFTVTINMCKTRDVDEGDELRFRYDFEGTGHYTRGICRASHTYVDDGCRVAVACASDRQPDHEICKEYTICPFPGAAQPAGNIRFQVSLSYADVTGDGCPDFVSIPWSQTASLGVPAGNDQVFIPLADSDGDGRPDSIQFDLDGDNVQDPDIQGSGRLAGDCGTSNSPSRLVGPLNPPIVDTDGNGPDGSDPTGDFTRIGNSVVLDGPWDATNNGNETATFSNPSGGVYQQVSRRTHYGSTQRLVLTNFSSGGATGFEIVEEKFGETRGHVSVNLLDLSNDGIFDTVEGVDQ